MINAKELRLGNWVNAFKTTYIIDSNDFQYVDSDTYLMPYDPIPLTEDILLKCGFVKSIYTNRDVYSYENFIVSIFKNRIEFGINSKRQLVTIKHLHQLQNLYFALTGEELKVEL